MTQSETTMPPGSYDTSNGPGWIGIDMDGTLAHYHGWYGVDHIGEPIPKMVERVRGYSRQSGLQVIIFTHERQLESVCDNIIRL